jgi:antitoxin VapB
MAMETAKIFMNGKSQAVRLPKECRFNATEVGVRKVGELVVLYPLGDAWQNFLDSEPVSDDVGEAIFEARRDNDFSSRVTL